MSHPPCYTERMTIKTETGTCKQCGNFALLLEGNDGTCLGCLIPKPEREPFEGQFIEGCECSECKRYFEKVFGGTTDVPPPVVNY